MIETYTVQWKKTLHGRTILVPEGVANYVVLQYREDGTADILANGDENAHYELEKYASSKGFPSSYKRPSTFVKRDTMNTVVVE